MSDANIRTLEALGFSRDHCVRALESCNDDVFEAAEYLLSYAGALEDEARQEALLALPQRAMDTLAEEDAFLAVTARELGMTASPSSSNSTTPSQQQLTLGTASSSYGYRTASGDWGFLIMISPVFSKPARAILAGKPEHQARINLIKRMTHDRSLDEAIIDLVNRDCTARGVDPLTLSPGELHPSTALGKRAESATHIRLRFMILRHFNRLLAQSLTLLDLSRQDPGSLAHTLRKHRRLVFSSVKRTFLDRVLQSTHCGDGNAMQRAKWPSVVLDRTASNVFGQLLAQLHRAVPPAKLRNSERAFYAVLAGEHSDDYGGPYRDALNWACQELMSPDCPLFFRCARGFVPHPRATTPAAVDKLEFLGKLMGIAVRTKTPLPLDLPSLVWKRLCQEPVGVADVEACDPAFAEELRALQRISSEEEWAALDVRFCVHGFDGWPMDLVPGGRDVTVAWPMRNEMIRLASKARVGECQRQCEAMLRGMATQVPRDALALLSWDELEVLVCGPPLVDLALLRQCTVYGEGVSEAHPVVRMFWRVLESLSEEDKRRYLRFVWGRTRLPLSARDFERKHKISILDLDESHLPIGHTCFFSVDLPLYASDRQCRDKLLYAITHCVTIDGDETTNARAAAETAGVARVESEEDLGF